MTKAMAEAQVDKMYEEVVSFSLVNFVIGTMAILAVLFLLIIIYQISAGPLGGSPAPNWFYLLMFLLFAGITALITNFRKLTITATSQTITVAFGIFKYGASWDNIEGCYRDEASGIAYGGWGIRMGRARGKWRLVFNVIGHSGIVLDMRKGRFRQFVFSTRNPEEIIRIAERQMAKARPA